MCGTANTEATSTGTSPLSMLPARSGERQGNAQVSKNERLERRSEEECRRIQRTDAGRRVQLVFKCSTPRPLRGYGAFDREFAKIIQRNALEEQFAKI